MLALTLDSARAFGIVAIAGLTAASFLTAKFVASLVRKLAFGVLFAALLALIITQFQSLKRCESEVRANAPAGRLSGQCRFFGHDVAIGDHRASPLGSDPQA